MVHDFKVLSQDFGKKSGDAVGKIQPYLENLYKERRLDAKTAWTHWA